MTTNNVDNRRISEVLRSRAGHYEAAHQEWTATLEASQNAPIGSDLSGWAHEVEKLRSSVAADVERVQEATDAGYVGTAEQMLSWSKAAQSIDNAAGDAEAAEAEHPWVQRVLDPMVEYQVDLARWTVEENFQDLYGADIGVYAAEQRTLQEAERIALSREGESAAATIRTLAGAGPTPEPGTPQAEARASAATRSPTAGPAPDATGPFMQRALSNQQSVDRGREM